MPVILGRPRVQPFTRTKSITSNYTVVLADAGWLIVVDTTGGNITVSLPAVATAGDGFVVTLKRITAGANTLTIDPSGAETVEGAATLALPTQYTSVMLVSRSTGWFIGSAPIPLGRTVTAGAGLSGGGALSADITLALAGSAPTAQVFTANGTWTRPAGCRRVKVIATGGGGGGGGADNSDAVGRGGGAGATAIAYVDVTALASQAVVVGAAGTAGTNTGGDGGDGGSSSFGAHAVAGGGFGGDGSASSGDVGPGGAGGTASAGGIGIDGGEGGAGFGGSTTPQNGGEGGASYWGGGGGSQTNFNLAGGRTGRTGTAWGSGGGGGASGSGTGATGGAGKGGMVVVEEYY